MSATKSKGKVDMNSPAYSHKALKSSAIKFIVGKLGSAFLTIIILLWLVRLLDIPSYGFYMAFIANAELALALMAFGLPWAASRYIPEYRLQASRYEMIKFIGFLMAFIVLIGCIGIVAFYWSLPWLLQQMDMADLIDQARLYLLVLFMEHVRRNIQDCILDPLLQQGYAQSSQISRSIILLLVLAAFLYWHDNVILLNVVVAEAIGTSFGAFIALLGLLIFMRNFRPESLKANWKTPRFREFVTVTLYMHFAHIVSMLSSRQFLLLMIQRFAGVEATALFGFLFNLYGQIARYLPAALFINIIRPKLVASYIDGDGNNLNFSANANLVGNLSLFVLTPILTFVVLSGDQLLALLSNNKFENAGWYFSFLMLALLPSSQSLILQTVAVTCNKSRLCYIGSLLSLLSLPLVYGLWTFGYGLWSVIIAVFFSEMVFNTVLIISLRITSSYHADLLRQFKIVMLGVYTGMFVLGLKLAMHLQWSVDFDLSFTDWLNTVDWSTIKLWVHQLWLPLFGSLYLVWIAIAVFGIFLLLAYLFKPFLPSEQEKINKMLPRKLFVW